MLASLLCLAVGLGVLFASTKSLIPSIIAHAIINLPLTPIWQGALLMLFVIGIFFVWRGGLRVLKQVFAYARLTVCVLLAALQTAYVLLSQRIDSLTQVAFGMLVVALILEAKDRRGSTSNPAIPKAVRMADNPNR